jgi:hypothetical protein
MIQNNKKIGIKKQEEGFYYLYIKIIKLFYICHLIKLSDEFLDYIYKYLFRINIFIGWCGKIFYTCVGCI